jgi:histidinol dehydrogenase
MCAMKSYRLSELSNAEVESLKARPRIDFSSIFGIVSNPFLFCFEKGVIFKI